MFTIPEINGDSGDAGSIRELLKLAGSCSQDCDFESALKFTERANDIAESLGSDDQQIVCQFVLMLIYTAMGLSDKAFTYAILLLEYLYTPTVFEDSTNRDIILHCIISAIAVLALNERMLNISDFLKEGSTIGKIEKIIDEGFSTIEVLGKPEYAYNFHFLQGCVEIAKREYAKAQDHLQLAMALFGRHEDGKLIDQASILLQLAYLQEMNCQFDEKRTSLILARGDKEAHQLNRIIASIRYLEMEIPNMGNDAIISGLEEDLKLIKALNYFPSSLIITAQLFDLYLQCKYWNLIFQDSVEIISFLRKRRHSNVWMFVWQVYCSICAEARFQQALSELGISDPDIEVMLIDEYILGEKINGVYKLLRQALRFSGRVSSFSENDLKTEATQLINSLDKLLAK